MANTMTEQDTALGGLRVAVETYENVKPENKAHAAELLAARARDFLAEVDGIRSGKVVNLNE